MNQIQQQNKWEAQGQELWQIYLNRWQYGNKQVPFSVFEHRFWQHYEQLHNNVKKNSHLAPVLSSPKTKSISTDTKFEYGIRQDLNTILRKYWRNGHTITYHYQDANVQKDKSVDGCLFPAALMVFGLVALVLVATKLFLGLFVWVILGIGLLALNDAFNTSESQQVNFSLKPDFIHYSGKDQDNQPIDFRLFYKDINTCWENQEVLYISGMQQGIPQYMEIPQTINNYLYVKKFIQEVVNYNQMRR